MHSSNHDLAMTVHHSFSRSKSPAAWQKLLIGLMAALALSLQGGAALAHTHGPTGVSGPDLTMVADAAGSVEPGAQKPVQPAQGELAAKCPLCHSPLSHGGVLTPVETVSISEIHYAAYRGVSFNVMPQQVFTYRLPPLRGPPHTI